jgi:hypothetical protein
MKEKCDIARGIEEISSGNWLTYLTHLQLIRISVLAQCIALLVMVRSHISHRSAVPATNGMHYKHTEGVARSPWNQKPLLNMFRRNREGPYAASTGSGCCRASFWRLPSLRAQLRPRLSRVWSCRPVFPSLELFPQISRPTLPLWIRPYSSDTR